MRVVFLLVHAPRLTQSNGAFLWWHFHFQSHAEADALGASARAGLGYWSIDGQCCKSSKYLFNNDEKTSSTGDAQQPSDFMPTPIC